VGIFDNLEKALAFDSEDVQGVVEGVEVLRDHFAALMDDAQRDYLAIGADLSADKLTEAVLEHFRDQERR
jgi:type I restriction enzyme R subunit